MSLGCLVFSPGRARFGWTLPGRALILVLLLLSSGCLAPVSFHIHLDKHYHGEESSKETAPEDLIRSIFDNVQTTEEK